MEGKLSTTGNGEVRSVGEDIMAERTTVWKRRNDQWLVKVLWLDELHYERK